MRHWKWAVWALLPLLTFLVSGSAAVASVDQVTTDIIVMIASGATLILSTLAMICSPVWDGKWLLRLIANAIMPS